MRIFKSLINLGFCALLLGCSTLPASGPGVEALLAETPEEALNGPTIPVELIELTPTTALAMQVPPVVIETPIPAKGVASRLFGLRVGDQVSILIQEAVTSLESKETTPTALPPQVIDASGQIMAPFAGAVNIAGLTPVNAAKRIQAKLEGQLVEPQVIVSLLSPVGRTVSVIGDAVRAGGLFPIRTGKETILEAIAATGGFALPLHATKIRLTRDNVSTVIRAEALASAPSLNMRLAPGDIVSVEIASRHYTILGAITIPGRFDFPAQEITLIEALAQARGLNDLAAAAQGVALLRQRDNQMPLLYRLDLRSRDGLLAAQLAKVEDGDLIYVAPAPISDVEKVLRILGLGTGPVLSTATLTGLGAN